VEAVKIPDNFPLKAAASKDRGLPLHLDRSKVGS